MKSIIYSILQAGLFAAFVCLTSCEEATLRTGPPLNVQPAVYSNVTTKKHIGTTRERIDKSQVKSKAGDKHMDNAQKELEKLLHAPQ